MPYIPPILARREIASNRFMTFVEEDIRDPTGKPYTYYQLEARWDAVLVVPVLGDGRLVLERIYRHPYRRYFLEFPAGGIDTGEAPEAAAIRELEEETGYRAASTRVIGCYEAIPGMLRARVTVVLAENLVQTGTRSHEAMELIEIVEQTRAQAWLEAEREPSSSFLTSGLLWFDRQRA
ncbi:MAG: NUDIX hydrolase [Planctomycetes bacterium]|nr:NUDIX hydrolase [Planctomycetota bacterium]